MRHGGDEVAVGLPGGLLVARALQDRVAHGVDARRQTRELVRADDGDGLVERARRADGLRQARDAPREPPREAEGDKRIDHEAQHERAEAHIAVEPRLGIVAHGDAVLPVGKLDGEEAVAHVGDVALGRVVEQLARAPGAGLVRVALRLIDDDVGVFLTARPLLDGQRVTRGDAARADVLLQAALVREVARRDGIIVQVPAVDRRGAERIHAEIARHAHGQRREQHDDHARIDRRAPLFNQSDTPFPRPCG